MPSNQPIAAHPDDSTGPRRGGKPRPAPSTGTSRSVGVNIVLVVLIAGLMVAGWFLVHQYQQLTAAEDSLSDASRRLGLLEDRLRMTDQTMSESGDEVQDQLGLWESEIRKLWDVANKRNKNWIEENQGKLKRHDERLGAVDASIANLKSSVSRYDEALGRQNAILDQLAAIELQVRQNVEQQRRTTDELNAMRQTVASLQSGLGRRVADNEEAIEAIDAYRIQLNNRLNDLRNRIEALHGVPPP